MHAARFGPDVLAVVHALKVDLPGRLIGVGQRSLNGRSRSSHTEDTAPAGYNRFALQPRSCVKDLHTVNKPGIS